MTKYYAIQMKNGRYYDGDPFSKGVKSFSNAHFWTNKKFCKSQMRKGETMVAGKMVFEGIVSK